MSMQVQGYGAIARALHWLMAALLIVQWFSGEYDDWLGPRFHFSLGLTLGLLVLIRLAWRIGHPAPPLPEGSPGWERLIARLMHVAWYALMIALPLSGVLWRQFRGKATSWFGLFDVPGGLSANKEWAHFMAETHEVLGAAFLILLGLHVLAALKHHFLSRDQVLRGMLFGSRTLPGTAR